MSDFKIQNFWPLLAAGVLALALQAQAGGKGWETDLDAAKIAAKDQNKHILVEFTGSDWCPPCMMMRKEVFTKEDFIKKAGENYILVELDFPRKKDQDAATKKKNEAAAKEFKIKGFPTVVLLDAGGKEYERLVGGRQGGVDGFLKLLEAARKKAG